MKTYTQSELDSLISLAKIIVEPPKKVWTEALGHARNEMALKAEDGQHEFSVFLRRNLDFPENFSIGLCYWPRESGREIPLIRCNGPHGNFGRTKSPHFHYHVHTVDAESLNAGVDPLGGAAATTAYASEREAIRHFCRTANIKDFEQYLATPEQLALRDEDGEELR